MSYPLNAFEATPTATPLPLPDDSSVLPGLLVTAAVAGAVAVSCMLHRPPPRPEATLQEFGARVAVDLTLAGIERGGNLLTRGLTSISRWWAIRQAAPLIQGHLATVQTNLRIATEARTAAQRLRWDTVNAANTPERSDRENANAAQITANAANEQAAIAERASASATAAQAAAAELIRQNPLLGEDPAIAANIVLINRDSPLTTHEATLARTAATAATTAYEGINNIAGVIDTLNGHIATARANLQTATQAREAAQGHLMATRAALENARGLDEHLATGNREADAAAEQARIAEEAVAQTRAIAATARGLAQTPSQIAIRDRINLIVRAAEEAAIPAREYADAARTLATDTSRRIQAEAALAEARQALNYDIFLFLEDLQAVTPHSYNAFIARMIRDYPLVGEEEIRATLQRSLMERRAGIEALVAYLRSDEATAGIITVNQEQISRSLRRASALRGIWGFDGLINNEWRTYFAAAKQEMLSVISIYKSLIPGENSDISDAERASIMSIDAQSEGSVASLMAIANTYKDRLPADLRERSFNDLVRTRASADLRNQYDQANRTKEAAFLRYGNLNTEYEEIGGRGFNPDVDFEERDGLRLYRAVENTAIDRRQKAITEPLAEIAQKVAFWERILAELAPAADAGAAAV